MDLSHLLSSLLASNESEVVEFKEAKSSYDFGKIGRYFSALSNEANLQGKPHAWLVFGVKDKGHAIVGSLFRADRKSLDSLKGEVADKTTNRITFVEIHEVHHPDGRVILFQIPAAPRGIPVAWEGHYYGRDGEDLGPLNLEEIERIRSQATRDDWSAGIIAEAGLDDLDDSAIQVARANYRSKFPDKAAEVDTWDVQTFLNKAKLTIKGKITRAALLLLGKEESEHFLSPADPKIRWLLKDNQGQDKDYRIMGPPLLLAVDQIYGRIRNLKYRYLKEGTLFPEEVDQYEPYSIREALNNCIAHQDYTLGGRINVVELDDQLVFTNLGSFVPGSVERVVMENAPEEHYRNQFLASAMFNIKMVDTAGGGIRKIFQFQRQRFFPMPDYDLTANRVKLTLPGKMLDLEHARHLARNPQLTLEEVIAFDQAWKHEATTHPKRGARPSSPEIAPKSSPKTAPESSPEPIDPILEILAQEPHLSTERLGQRLDISKRTVLKRIEQLRALGRIGREGAQKNGRWVVVAGHAGSPETTHICSPETASENSPEPTDPILEILAREPQLTTEAVGQRLRISKRAVLKRIERLRAEGLIGREGAQKNGRWVVHWGRSAN